MRCKICGKILLDDEEEVCQFCDEAFYYEQSRKESAEKGKKYFRATRNIFRTYRGG